MSDAVPDVAPQIVQPQPRPTHARLPSLNQLAARINPASQASATAARPRLPTELLRTGSAMSVTSTATAMTNDSMVVQPGSTRSASPSPNGTDDLQTGTPTGTTAKELPPGVPKGDNELTSEKLEKLEESVTTAMPPPAPVAAPSMGTKAPRGYKNIPSLDALTERMRKISRTVSIDGSAMPSPGGTGLPGITLDSLTLEESEGEKEKEPEHPLQHPWCIFHDSKPKAAPPSGGPGAEWTPPPTTESSAYLNQLTLVGSFDTVESFCRYQNWLKPPSRLEKNSNYHLFKEGIKPMWEDPSNADGGKWVLTMRQNPALLDRCWSWLCMALVGEELEEGDEICGAVVSLRTKVDRIQLWTRSKTDVERLNAVARKMIKLLDVSESDNVGLEFQYNSDDHPPPNKFISMQSSFPQSSMRATFSPHPNGPGGGEGGSGSFGIGGGGGAFGWRKR